MTAPATATGLPLPDCAAVKASGLVGGALGDAFYERYPMVLADPATVEGVALDDAAIGNVVGYLACVAALTDGDPVVADNAAPLFHSPRHSPAAFARLAAMPEAARLLAQMKGIWSRPLNGVAPGRRPVDARRRPSRREVAVTVIAR